MRKLLAVVLIACFVVFAFFQFYLFLKKRLVTTNFKLLTENRISQFIGARVRVDRISIGFLKHISVSGLKIDRTGKGFPFLLGAKKIVVRYDLMNFMKRDFLIPKDIFLDSPQLTLKAFQSPGALFETALLRSDRGFITTFELEEGRIELPWPTSEEKLYLSKIRGKARPRPDGIFHLEFDSQLEHVASGTISAQGELDPHEKKIQLVMTLANVNFSKSSQLPISKLNGTLEFKGNTLRLNHVKFLFRDIPCELEGEIQDVFSGKPALAVSVRLEEGKPSIRLKFNADLKNQTVHGEIHAFDQAHGFSGSLLDKGRGTYLSDFVVDDLYKAHGDFNLREGIYEIIAQRDPERVHFSFSMVKFSGNLVLRLEHFKIYDFDFVTAARFYFKPNEEAWNAGNHVFDMHVETDYFVFQYQPLRDFQGNAQLSIHGLDEILIRWGSVSELRGQISFGHGLETNLVIRAGPISLKELKSFGTHPLPSTLDGVLEGKVMATGSLEKPELEGAFTINDGAVGKLTYDRALVNFSGHLPYLLLHDSKVWISNSTFLLKGGVDFKFRNFLQGVEIVNSEHVLIWKGLELSRELDEMVVGEIGESVTSHPLPASLVGSGSVPARVEGEYKLGGHTSFKVTAEEDQNKREYLTAGPKLKF